jgi:hypothetical protein
MMKRSTLACTALATLFALAVSPVPAAGPDMPARGPVPFNSFDTDGNGEVSQEEFNRAHTERLQQRILSEKTYRHMGNPPAFGEIDSNADGGLSREEIQAHQQQQRETHQQQYQQRQQQMYQDRTNMGGPGGMGSGQGRGQGGGRR